MALVVTPAIASDKSAPERKTILGVRGTEFTLGSRSTFLYGVSYYGALGASKETARRDLDQMQRLGFKWIRVWANWGAFDRDVSAVEKEGHVRPEFFDKLAWLIAECDGRGMVVDVSLSRGNGVSGPPRLQSLEAHRRAVENIVTALRPYRNWYLDLSNERNIKEQRYTSMSDLKELLAAAKKIDPDRLVTASHAGDISRDELKEYLLAVQVDFISPHRPRNEKSPGQTEAKSREYLTWMKDLGRSVPLHYQEPFRRGFGHYEPSAEDFATDLRGAKAGGAAGWCFHNGDQRAKSDGQPRRSFDLREKGLFEQLDKEEKSAVELLKEIVAP